MAAYRLYQVTFSRYCKYIVLIKRVCFSYVIIAFIHITLKGKFVENERIGKKIV